MRWTFSPAISPASLVAWRWASEKYAGTVITASVTVSPRYASASRLSFWRTNALICCGVKSLSSIFWCQSVPMWRFTERMVRSTLVTACRLATSPTRTSPDLANATTDGVVRAPSALGMTVGSPPSSTATTLFVVPRSMPTARAMLGYLRVVRLAIQPVCTGSRHHLDDQCRVDKILESGRLNFLSRAQRRGVPRMFPVLKEFRVVRLTTGSTPWSGGRPEDLELGAPVVDQVTADGRAVGGVPGADLPVDDGEGTAQRGRVTGEHQLDLGQQRLGRPLGHRKRVLAQLPRQVLVVGPQPS